MSNKEIGTLSTDFLFLGTYISQNLSKSHLSLIETLNTAAKCYYISQSISECDFEFLMSTFKSAISCLTKDRGSYLVLANKGDYEELNKLNRDTRLNECLIKIVNDLSSTGAYLALVFYIQKEDYPSALLRDLRPVK